MIESSLEDLPSGSQVELLPRGASALPRLPPQRDCVSLGPRREAEDRGLQRSEVQMGPPNGLEEATGARSLLFLCAAGGEEGGPGTTPSRTFARQVGHVVQCLSTAGLLSRDGIYSPFFL